MIAIFVPALAAAVDEVDDAVADAARGADLPVLLVTFGPRAPRAGSCGRRGSPIRRTPPAPWRGSCATSSGAMSRAGLPALNDVRRGAAAEVLAAAVADGGRWLREGGAAPVGLLGSAAGGAADGTRPGGGWPRGRRARRTVVLKASGEGIVHKTELGAVELGLVGEQEVAARAAHVAPAAGRRPARGELRRTTAARRRGRDACRDQRRSSAWAARGMRGRGNRRRGARRRGRRLAPITDREAARMVRSLSTFPLLDGYRGAPRRTWRRSRTYCSGSARSPTPIPRWPSSTATRSWSPSEARPRSTPACASSRHGPGRHGRRSGPSRRQ